MGRRRRSSSTEDTTTTTTTTLCPLEKLYGEESGETELLRNSRDNLLNETPEGQELIRLYYEWSPAIAKEMEENEVFKKEVQEVIEEILPLVRERVE